MKKSIVSVLLFFSFHLSFSQHYISNLEEYNVDNGLSHNQINWIHKDQRGMLWVGTFNGINRFDGQEFKYVAKADFVHVSNRNIKEDEEGDLWLFKDRKKQELFFFNTITEQIKTVDEKLATNPSLQKDENFIYGEKKLIDTLGSFALLKETFQELEVTAISSLLKDGNNYWVGTINGLFKIQLRPSFFKKSLYKNPAEYSQKDFNSCRGVFEDEQGQVYATTQAGVFNVKTGKPLQQAWKDYSHLNVLKTQNRDMLWSNFKSKNILSNLKTGKQVSFRTEEILYNEAWSYFEDRTGRIWGGTSFGLTYYEEGFKNFKAYKKNNAFTELKENVIYDFFEDKNEKIWLATSNGLYELDLEKGVVGRYWSEGKGKYYFPSNKLQQVYQDDQGIFWIASREGLIRWNQEKSTTQLFTNKDGLSNSNLNALYEDDFGFIWMSSDNGIIQFQKETFKVKNYRVVDGISHPEFNRISSHQATDGTIYFGGLNGVTYFHPRDFVASFEALIDIPLVMTEAKIFSEKSQKQENRITDFYQKNKITIAPDDRYLSLQFALLDYDNSKASQYVYTINGEEWSASKEHTINISSLPYGNHILEVKARAGNGLFSKNKLAIPLEVLKPFYLQWWFLGLGFLALMGGIVFYQKNKTRRLIERQQELEEVVQERTQTIQNQTQTLQVQAEELLKLNKTKSKFMANISHELRTPLTLILNTMKRGKPNDNKEGKIFTFQKTEVEMVQRNAHRLQQLIEQLLDLSKLEANKMSLRASQRNFYQYLKELTLSFRPLAESKNINLTFFSEFENCELYFDRDKLDKIIYNLLSNALKFTKEKENVTVLLFEEKENVVLKINDSGIGISDEDLPFIFDRFYRGKFKDEYTYEGTGLGLALVKDFVEIHAGKIEVESEIGKGTTFTIRLPLGQAHLKSDEIIIPTEDKSMPNIIPTLDSNLEEILTPTVEEEAPILLIIEDNEDLLYHHQQIFQNDYRLLLAKDGQTGINMAIEHLPDVIICDVMMPKRNGYEVCQILKLDEKTNHIPIILLTAKAGREEKLEGLMVGADEYLIKPYSQKELDIRLKNLLTHQKLIREKFNLSVGYSIPSTTIKTPQQQFAEKCKNIVDENYASPQFGVEEWSAELHMSRSQLFRKAKTIMGTTPMNFLRTYRLEKAKELLNQHAGNGSEVAYMVGFNNPNYFFKCFKDEYGMTVGDFIKSH